MTGLRYASSCKKAAFLSNLFRVVGLGFYCRHSPCQSLAIRQLHPRWRAYRSTDPIDQTNPLEEVLAVFVKKKVHQLGPTRRVPKRIVGTDQESSIAAQDRRRERPCRAAAPARSLRRSPRRIKKKRVPTLRPSRPTSLPLLLGDRIRMWWMTDHSLPRRSCASVSIEIAHDQGGDPWIIQTTAPNKVE